MLRKRLRTLKMATQVGFEPTIVRLTAECINHYATESKVAHFTRCAGGYSSYTHSEIASQDLRVAGVCKAP